MAAELVALKVNVIVAEFTPAVQAAKQASSAIPIVMAPAGDPVATGLVASLARPGGNVTGVSNVAAASVPRPGELERALVGLTKAGARAVIVPGKLPVSAAAMVQAAQRHGLPSISLSASFRKRAV